RTPRGAVAVVSAAADRPVGTRGAHPQTDDRALCLVCARRPGWLLRARYCSDARDQALLFRADPRFHRAPARPLPVAGGDRLRLVAADRPLLAAHLDLRSPQAIARLSAGRLCRLCPPRAP